MPPGNPSGAFSGSAAGLVPLATERSRCRKGSTSVTGGQKWYFKNPFKSMVWWVLRILMLQIRRPAGVSCGSCLFVVVLSVLSLSLSRLSPWRRFLPRLTCTHLALLRFVFIFSYVVVGSTLPTPRSTPAWFCTCCCDFDGLIHWLLCRTPFTRISWPFPKPFSIWPFPKPWFTHMLWFKLKPWFEQNHCFCVQTIFYTKSCFIQKLC